MQISTRGVVRGCCAGGQLQHQRDFLRTATLQLSATHCNTRMDFLLLNLTKMYVDMYFIIHIYLRSHCNTPQHKATYCNTLQHTATHCNTLQHTATHRNLLQNTCIPCTYTYTLPFMIHINIYWHEWHRVYIFARSMYIRIDTATNRNTLQRMQYIYSLSRHSIYCRSNIAIYVLIS